jgi:hypothetical protein
LNQYARQYGRPDFLARIRAEIAALAPATRD